MTGMEAVSASFGVSNVPGCALISLYLFTETVIISIAAVKKQRIESCRYLEAPESQLVGEVEGLELLLREVCDPQIVSSHMARKLALSHIAYREDLSVSLNDTERDVPAVSESMCLTTISPQSPRLE
jgi:hypothetical protein